MNKTHLDKSKHYESLKKLLITAGYPEIKYKNIEFVKTLLSKQNRIQLLTWSYIQINEDLSNNTVTDDSSDNTANENLDITKPILESFLIENGLCRTSEVESFITGSNIKASKEFEILKRMFFFITCIQHTESSTEDSNIEPFTPETLSEIVKKKQNVLPAYIVPNYNLSEDKKQILYNDLMNENIELEEKIRELETKLSLSEDLSVSQNKNIENVEQILSDFEDNEQFENFISNFTLIKNMNKTSDNLQNIHQIDRQSAIIHDCLTHLNKLLNMVEAVKFLKQLEQNAQQHQNSTKTENDVNTENIQILEKTLAKLKEYGKQ